MNFHQNVAVYDIRFFNMYNKYHLLFIIISKYKNPIQQHTDNHNTTQMTILEIFETINQSQKSTFNQSNLFAILGYRGEQ